MKKTSEPVLRPPLWQQLLPQSAVALTVGAAVVYFAGATYYEAYLGRVGLEPGITDIDRGWLGVRGAIALMTMLLETLGLALPLLILAASTLIGAAVAVLGHRRHWWNINPERPGLGILQMATTGLMKVSVPLSCLLVVTAAGPKLGREDAERDIRIANAGGGFDYRLKDHVLHGVSVMQDRTRVWLLTKNGVIGIKVDDLAGIGGRQFQTRL